MNALATHLRLLTPFPLCALLLIGAGCKRNNADTGPVLLSGNIEVTDAQVAFKIPGRLLSRALSEGQTAKEGQLIARLDDLEWQAQLALRQADLALANAALAELENGTRPQEIAAAAATVRSLEAERDRLRLESKRQQDLFAQNAITSRDLETVQAQLAVASAKVDEAGERLKLLREGPRTEAIQQARARVAQATASLSLAETQLENTRLLAPLSGPVISHNIEPGEIVAAGTPVLTIADLAHPWVRVYLNEPDLGRVRLGQKVTIHTDSFPGRSFEGTLGFIASEAEFTPKTVQTSKERVKLVFRLKILVPNADGLLKPGMPADVSIPELP